MMNMKLLMGLGLSLVLVACASKREKDTDPMHWGSFKCAAKGGGKLYSGWSTDEKNAKRNAMALCHEHAKNCQFKSCKNESLSE